MGIDNKMKEHKDALEEIKSAAERHPCFMGYEEDGMTREVIDAEGGDCAFVTLDIAWVAKAACEACDAMTAEIERLRTALEYTCFSTEEKNMNIWKILQEQAIEHNGKTIETTLLGKALPMKTDSGELTGFIPPNLQEEANRYGLVIEDALWREGRYVLRIVPPNV